MILRRSSLRAFTLLEVLVATSVFTMVGLVAYGVASEGLYAFSRNISINRSYGDARRALDRIGSTLQTAGYTPLLVDATGAATVTSPAAGIRFWRYGSTPCYNITTPVLTSSSIVLSLYQPGTTVIQPAPSIGDLITISSIGFQAKAVSVITSGTSATVTFSTTVANSSTVTKIPATTSTTTSSGTVTTTIQYSCLDWTPVAIIAVGTELRYYPTFIYGTTAIGTASNYKVLTNLVPTVGTTTAPLPFSLGNTPTVNVDIYAEAPDYNKRNLGTSNTYTFLQTAFAPRNPALLTNPY